MTLRNQVYRMLERPDRREPVGRAVDIFLITLIIVNLLSVVFETVDWFYADYRLWFITIEVVSVAIFTVEYLARIWCCVEQDPDKPASSQRIGFALTPLALIDLLAIAPFYLAFLVTIDLRVLRVLRLLRIFKMTRYSSAMTMLLDVFRQEASAFVAGFFILVVLLVLAASGEYLVEHSAQPDKFGSIPEAMWWAVATLTTVGYGDVTPVTPLGKLFGALVTIIGIGMAALPAGILASGLADQLRRKREALAEQYRLALQDGKVDAEEKEALEEFRKSLGLSKALASEVLDKMRKRGPDVGQRFCPHCGSELGHGH